MMRHPQLLWETFSSVSPPSFYKMSCLTSHLNLPCFSLKPLSLVLPLQALVKSLSPSFLETPYTYCKAARRSLQGLLFSRLNSANSLSLPSSERCSNPLITSRPSSGLSLMDSAESSHSQRRDISSHTGLIPSQSRCAH